MNSKPLVVDLDGTLIKTNLLFEAVNRFCIRHPFQFFRLFIWLYKGKRFLKTYLAKFSDLDPAFIPYNQSVIAWLQEQKEQGRYLILATENHKKFAQLIANYLGFFDEVLATTGKLNLKASSKRDLLLNYFGESGFDYLGDCTADLPIWMSADRAYIANPSKHLIKKLQVQNKPVHVLKENTLSFIKSWFKAFRPYQWMKNVLVFVPLFAAHQYTNNRNVILALLAFIIFNIIASSIYLFNDLVDVTDDRRHRHKRNRPFAAGDLSLLCGWLSWPLLLCSAFLFASAFMPFNFCLTLGLYSALTLAYSLRLKQIPILDVLILATLYTLRIIVGTAAISVPLSFWLLAFSMFLFASLAFIKRFSELQLLDQSGDETILYGRGYRREDLQIISNMGISAGYLAVLILSFYIKDEHTAEMYASPQLIWFACFVLLYWISRIWLIANRGNMHDDLIIFVLKDKLSWFVAVVFIVIFLLAKVGR